MPIVRSQENRPFILSQQVLNTVKHIGLDGLGLYVWLLGHEETRQTPAWHDLAMIGLEEAELLSLLHALQYAGLITYETEQDASDTVPDHRVNINPGYVYVIEGHGYYKIGLSTEPKKRIKNLQTSVPFPLRYIHLIATSYMVQTETLLHTTFAKKRTNGEWFALDEQDVTWIRETFPAYSDGGED